MDATHAAATTFPLAINFSRTDFEFGIYGGQDFSLTLRSGLTAMVGPNSSGKTRILYGLRNKLRTVFGPNAVRFVSAGRMGAIEASRSIINGTEGDSLGNSVVGNYGWFSYRTKSETLVGDFMALSERIDIRLKVASRLETLFGKRLSLNWTQSGLQIEYANLGGTNYGAGREASGLVHLTALLAALYDDDIKALLIDEPEVSLHPQLQSFLLSEMREVAGDPSIVGKKLIVLCTHSPMMLAARHMNDLTSTIFFRGSLAPPVQIAPGDGVFGGTAISTFILSLGEVHRLALFARSVLLVEGASDEMIVNALVEIARRPLAAAGVQVVPVHGKGSMATVAKFFRAIGKSVYVLADLDAFVDGNALVNLAKDADKLQQIVEAKGHASLADFDRAVRTCLATVVSAHWEDIAALAEQHPYFTGTNDPALAKKRASMAALFAMTDQQIDALPSAVQWRTLRALWTSFFDTLDAVGFVALRIGAIESYFTEIPNFLTAKPDEAAKEIRSMLDEDVAVVSQRYANVLRAIDVAGKIKPIDEAQFLRRGLGAVIGAAMVNLRQDASDDEIRTAVADGSPDYSKMFAITNASANGQIAVRVEMMSSIFSGYAFPFVFRVGDTMASLEQMIPSP